jgi:type VI secretion system (T6SS) effector TldE1-like protein
LGRIRQMSVETLIAAPDRGTYRVAVFVAALVASACAASAIDQDLATPIFDHPPPFGDRFTFSEAPVRLLEKSALGPLARAYSTDLGTLQRAKILLAQKLEEFRADGSLAAGQRDARNEAAIPLPRSRPVQARLDLEKARANGGQTLFDKIAGWFAGGTTLASLTPDAGSSDGSNIRSLGVDDHTAVYDISARAVYMPGGAKLEAHSGFGGLRDSPDHVSERDVGATPPAFYDLRPRESLFHGVQALRMIPVEGQSTLGRDGLLAHGYMLGPDGDSNGCVSIRDYDKFLAAFQNGEVNRLLVVTSLGAAARTTQAQL